MAPKTQKPTKAAPKEEVKEEPAAAAVTVVGTLGPNAGKTVQGMSFLNMLKKNANHEPAKEEEKKPKEAPVLADLPAAAPQPKAKKGKKEPAVVAAPVPEAAPVEEPAVEAEPEPVVVAPVEEEVVVEEPAVVVEAPVVEAAAPASFNWADAGNDFTQFSSRTEILHTVEPVVEKLAPPAPLVTFRVPFVLTPGLMFVAPSHAMLVQNRLAAVESREQQVLLRETTNESSMVGIAQKEKALADAKTKQAEDRELLNRERDAFRLQQQQHQQQQQQLQKQQQSMQQQHHHHHHQPPQQQHHYPQQHSSHEVSRNWADDDFNMYETPAPHFRGTPQPNYRPHHHHQMSARSMQPQFGGSGGYGQQYPPHQRMGGAPRMPPSGQQRNMMYPHNHHATHNAFGSQESGPW